MRITQVGVPHSLTGILPPAAEVSVGMHGQGHMTIGPPGMKLVEDKDGNARMQIQGIQDVVIMSKRKEEQG